MQEVFWETLEESPLFQTSLSESQLNDFSAAFHFQPFCSDSYAITIIPHKPGECKVLAFFRGCWMRAGASG